MWPNDIYGYDKNFFRDLNAAAEHQFHKERRPRALNYSTDKFYNFPIKHKKKRFK